MRTSTNRPALAGAFLVLVALMVGWAGEEPSRPTSAPDACTAELLSASVALTGAVMSQPFSDIALTNTGVAPCALRGYPSVDAWGHPEGRLHPGSTEPVALRLHHGLYERKDPGAQRLVVQPGHRVFFSVGTATAYQGGRHPLDLTRLAVALPGTRRPLSLRVDLLATHPRHSRTPVGITAITRKPHA